MANTVSWDGEKFFIKENPGFKRNQHFVIKNNKYFLWWSPFENIFLPNYYSGELLLVDKKEQDLVKLKIKNGVIINISFLGFEDFMITDLKRAENEIWNRY